MFLYPDSIHYSYPPALQTPVNLMQRFAMFRARRELKFQYARHIRFVAYDLRRLNHWAFHAYHEQGARFQVYRVKADFLHTLYYNGLVDRVEPEQQILKCNACTRGVWNRGAWNEDTCFKCNGTGIHKRVLLYKFTIGAPYEDIVFHLPANRCEWLAPNHQHDAERDGAIETLPKYRRFDYPPPPISEWEFQNKLVRVAYFAETARLFEKIQFNSLRSSIQHDSRVIGARVGQRWRKFVWTLNSYRLQFKYRNQKDDLPF